MLGAKWWETILHPGEIMHWLSSPPPGTLKSYNGSFMSGTPMLSSRILVKRLWPCLLIESVRVLERLYDSNTCVRTIGMQCALIGGWCRNRIGNTEGNFQHPLNMTATWIKPQSPVAFYRLRNSNRSRRRDKFPYRLSTVKDAAAARFFIRNRQLHVDFMFQHVSTICTWQL